MSCAGFSGSLIITPAMAAGITNQVLGIDELISWALPAMSALAPVAAATLLQILTPTKARGVSISDGDNPATIPSTGVREAGLESIDANVSLHQ
jgi:hypothetical protein